MGHNEQHKTVFEAITQPSISSINGEQAEEMGEMFNILPSSPLDEEYLIRLCLYSKDRAEEVTAKIGEEDFFNAFNQRIFKAILLIIDRGLTPTTHEIAQELFYNLPEADKKSVPFDLPSSSEIAFRYQKGTPLDARGIDGAVARLKQDTQYREIIFAANDALLRAKTREGDPLQILEGVDNLNTKLLTSGRSVITWLKDYEAEAQETYDALDRGELVAIPSGYPELDALLYGGGFWGGDFVIVSAATSGGKTTFALNIAQNQAEIGIPSLYFSLEMQTFKLFSRIHSARARVPGYKIRPEMSKLYGSGVRERLRSTGERVAALPIGLVDSVKDMASIRRITKFAVKEYGVKTAYIDYLGLATPSKSFKGSRYERNSIVSEQTKELALELGIPIVGLLQLRRKTSDEKKAAGTSEGQEVEPMLDMLKESGSYENDADTIAFLWGEKGKEGEREAIRTLYGKVDKQRQGGLGRFKLMFAPDIFHFSSIKQLEQAKAKAEEEGF